MKMTMRALETACVLSISADAVTEQRYLKTADYASYVCVSVDVDIPVSLS